MLECVLHGAGHANLPGTMLVSRDSSREWPCWSKQVPRVHGRALARGTVADPGARYTPHSVIPIRDLNKTRRTPIVTWGLIGANVLVFIATLSTGAEEAENLVMRFGVIPDVLVHGAWSEPRSLGGALGSWVTPFTSMFLHGGLLHLASNMLFLHVFGDNVEDVLGRVRFLLFYVLCGLGAVFGHVLVEPSGMVPMIGASGAISGVLAAYVTLFPHARIVTLIPIFIFIHFMEVPAGIFIVLWFVLQLVLGYLSLGVLEGGGGVAWFAHIGGFLAGLIFIRLFYKKRATPRRRRRWAH